MISTPLKKLLSEYLYLLVLIIPVFIVLLYWVFQNTSIGFLALHSIDEYAFQGSIRHMLESVLSGNISGLFGFGFYQYGFIYFFINLLAATPGILTDNYVWAISAPRIVTALFAVGSLWYIYAFARLLFTSTISALIATCFITMPAFWFNATWFHPDFAMTFFLIVCIYYLTKDNWNFGRYFTYAVVAYGFALAFKYQALSALPILGLYIFYDTLLTPSLRSLLVALRRFFLSFGSALAIFLICNPYILHPLGWRAFSSSFSENMLSNATNHGSGNIVTLTAKINLAIGDFYLNVLFLFILIIGSLWLLWRLLRKLEKSIFVVIAINFLINLGYLLVYVNKDWQIYYLPVVVTGLLSLLYFIKPLSGSRQKLILISFTLAQFIIYSSTYIPILTNPREAKSSDYITYTEPKQVVLDNFLVNNLQGQVSDDTQILLSAYTPFSFHKLGLHFNQIKINFGELTRSNFSKEDYLDGQRNYWGTLKTDAELLASFTSPDIIILRKDLPFMVLSDLPVLTAAARLESYAIVKELYNGTLGYSVLTQNGLVVIFNKTN